MSLGIRGIQLLMITQLTSANTNAVTILSPYWSNHFKSAYYLNKWGQFEDKSQYIVVAGDSSSAVKDDHFTVSFMHIQITNLDSEVMLDTDAAIR